MKLSIRILVGIVGLTLLAGCAEKVDGAIELKVLGSRVDQFVEFVKAGDVDGIMGQYESDPAPVGYFPYGELDNADAIRKAWEEFFATSQVIDMEVTDIRYKLDRHLAVTYGVWKMTFKRGDQEQTMHGRFTDVTAKREGVWRTMHKHVSIPLPKMPVPENVSSGGEA